MSRVVWPCNILEISVWPVARTLTPYRLVVSNKVIWPSCTDKKHSLNFSHLFRSSSAQLLFDSISGTYPDPPCTHTYFPSVHKYPPGTQLHPYP